MVKRKGSRLKRLRDEAILARFNYWYNQQRLRIDDVMTQMSEREFFLEPETLIGIIQRMQKEKNKKEAKE